MATAPTRLLAINRVMRITSEHDSEVRPQGARRELHWRLGIIVEHHAAVWCRLHPGGAGHRPDDRARGVEAEIDNRELVAVAALRRSAAQKEQRSIGHQDEAAAASLALRARSGCRPSGQTPRSCRREA